MCIASVNQRQITFKKPDRFILPFVKNSLRVDQFESCWIRDSFELLDFVNRRRIATAIGLEQLFGLVFVNLHRARPLQLR